MKPSILVLIVILGVAELGAANKFEDLFGIKDMKGHESVYSQLVPHYQKEGFEKTIDKTHPDGYTLLFPNLPKTKEEKDRYKELFARPDNYSNEFLNWHTISGVYSLEELAEMETVEALSGDKLHFKSYENSIYGLVYTVNGIHTEKDNVTLGPKLVGHFIHQALWYPAPKPNYKDKHDGAKPGSDADPMTSEIAEVFSKASHLPPGVFLPFIEYFKQYSGIGETPFTLIKPRDTSINSWARAFQFTGPASFPPILSQCIKYVIPCLFGPTDMRYSDWVTNLAGEKVEIIPTGDYFKYKDVLVDAEQGYTVPEGHGFIFPDAPPAKNLQNNGYSLFG